MLKFIIRSLYFNLVIIIKGYTKFYLIINNININ